MDPLNNASLHAFRTDLIAALKSQALRLGDFTLASGRKSHYYIDARKVTLSALGAEQCGHLLLARMRTHNASRIGGLTLGADPLVAAALTVAAAQFYGHFAGFLVRKEAKGHGTGQQVEGNLKSGDRCLIVEDVTTTGGSALQAVEAARERGAVVIEVVTVLDRLEGAAEAFARAGVPFHALTTIRDLGVEPLA